MWPIQLPFLLFTVGRVSLLLHCVTLLPFSQFTDLLHPFPAPHFKNVQVFLICFPKYPSSITSLQQQRVGQKSNYAQLETKANVLSRTCAITQKRAGSAWLTVQGRATFVIHSVPIWGSSTGVTLSRRLPIRAFVHSVPQKKSTCNISPNIHKSLKHVPTLSCLNPVHAPYPLRPTSPRPVLIISSHICLRIPSGIFPSCFAANQQRSKPILWYFWQAPRCIKGISSSATLRSWPLEDETCRPSRNVDKQPPAQAALTSQKWENLITNFRLVITRLHQGLLLILPSSGILRGVRWFLNRRFGTTYRFSLALGTDR